MSSIVVQAPPSVVPTSASSAEANHLRRIVEKQPACLFRVDGDGLILAANDAALALLGATQLAQALGKVLPSWVLSDQQTAWRGFAANVATGSSLSIECDLIDVTGVQRTVAFHGVPLIDHADGIPSLILGARDVTALRRLESALHESETVRQQLAITQSTAPAEDRTAMVQELETRLNRAEADRDQLERAVSRLPQLEQLLKQGRVHLQELRGRLEQTTQERAQLAAQLSERESANELLWTEQADLQQSLAEQHAREMSSLRAQLEEANAARQEMTGRIADSELRHEYLGNERSQLQQAIDAHQVEMTALRSQLDSANAEREQLVSQLADRVCQHELALTQQEETHRADSEAQRQALEVLRAEMQLQGDDYQRELMELRGRFDETSAERDRANDLVRESEKQRQQTATDYNAERGRFGDALETAIRQLTERERMLADHKVELKGLDVAIRQLEPLASAGRLAADVARELVSGVADVDAQSALLVAECAPGSTLREEVERLRADAVRLASLARQILQAGPANPSEADPSC